MTIWQNLQQTVHRWNRDDVGTLAASVAYYGAISLFPALLLVISGVGVVLEWTQVGHDARDEVLKAIAQQLSPALSQHVANAMEQVAVQAELGGPLGITMLMVTALAIFAQFLRAVDRIWAVPASEEKSLWSSIADLLLHRVRALILLASLAAGVVLVFCASVAMDAVRVALPAIVENRKWMWWILQSLADIGLNALVFSLLYRWVPRTKVAWQFAVRGGWLTAVTWEVGRQVLAAFVIGHHYSSTYGVIGSLLAVLLWGYYAIAVVLFGATYTRVLWESQQRTSLRGWFGLWRVDAVGGRVLDILFGASLLYVGTFVLFTCARMTQTAPSSGTSIPPDENRSVIFSRNPTWQSAALQAYAPLIAIAETIPGHPDYPRPTHVGASAP